MQTQLTTPATVAGRRGLGGALWRLRQFGHMMRSRPDAAVDAELLRLLDCDAQWFLLARLSPFDRAHHLRVHTVVVESGYDDPDLLRAALLHDIGKADDRGRVNAVHRAAHVLLERLSPTLLTRVIGSGDGFRHGLWLSVLHPALGASLASEAGASARCCALIASHADHAGGADPLQAALASADDAAIR
ncbi:MAG: hypothetical protein WEC79_07345 [Thermomicrobiales bacterium]